MSRMLGSSSWATSFPHSHGLISQQAHVPWGQMSTGVTDKIRESGLLVGTQKVPEGWELLGKWTSKLGGVKGPSSPFRSIPLPSISFIRHPHSNLLISAKSRRWSLAFHGGGGVNVPVTHSHDLLGELAITWAFRVYDEVATSSSSFSFFLGDRGGLFVIAYHRV